MGDTDLVSNKFPITIDHLNPNSRFSTTFPVVDTTTVNITENGAASLEPNTSYMNAVVQDNSPSGHSAELDAVNDTISPSARAIRGVTGESRAGLFESGLGPDNPVKEDELEELSRKMPIEGLEPGCARNVYLGIWLPDTGKETEEISAAFMLAEQVTGEGNVVGGVAVVAVSSDLPVPDSGVSSGEYSVEGEGG
ncbi:hypothetical protein FGG08_005694 [Glutinoglossum americanum]|uniref:Uncharacterized protein n=1 Tax=Glutinoglossum americanum TaxID=1670608 RepID=A0A9P8KY94_9PEZI|nr:hypothetical protein FGG08_005694 [Glutinoglossum americanum]